MIRVVEGVYLGKRFKRVDNFADLQISEGVGFTLEISIKGGPTLISLDFEDSLKLAQEIIAKFIDLNDELVEKELNKFNINNN